MVGLCTDVLSTFGRKRNLGVATVGDVGLRSSAMHCRLCAANSGGSSDSFLCFNCFSNSSSCPRKLKLGDMVGLLSLTYLQKG